MDSSVLLTVITFIVGFLLGIGIAWWLKSRQQRETEQLRKQDMDAMAQHLKLTFGSISSEVLSKASDEFMKARKSLLESDREMTARELESKKSLIDQQLKSMNQELDKVQDLMNSLEKDRSEKFGQLDSSLRSHQQQVQQLMQTTSSLREALASTKARGQWGERMAEDVLRLAGFIEGVNYEKQKTIEGSGTRPDFTFPLPQGQVLNMDVKFPLDNYLRYLDEDSDVSKGQFSSAFIRDIKEHIKAVSSREYINPQQNTVDYALMFIPNEQVYGFIHEQDASLLDTALMNKVIVCSPLTLYAILAVIRQAVDNFSLEKTSHKMLSLLGGFKLQWEKFLESLETLGKRLESTRRGYEDVIGTRRRQLDRVLDKLEDLRQQKGISAEGAEDVESDESDTPLLEETEHKEQ